MDTEERGLYLHGSDGVSGSVGLVSSVCCGGSFGDCTAGVHDMIDNNTSAKTKGFK